MSNNEESKELALAQTHLTKKLAELAKLLKECENLADEYGLMFDSPVKEYGMGGTYYGKGKGVWKADKDEEYDDEHYGWNSSNRGC